MKLILIIALALIAFAIVLPLLHLLLAVLVVAGGVIVVMAAWKVLFGSSASPTVVNRQGGPPALP
jgi:small neutral amino acid transporter SnatA (MarC family)